MSLTAILCIPTSNILIKTADLTANELISKKNWRFNGLVYETLLVRVRLKRQKITNIKMVTIYDMAIR